MHINICLFFFAYCQYTYWFHDFLYICQNWQTFFLFFFFNLSPLKGLFFFSYNNNRSDWESGCRNNGGCETRGKIDRRFINRGSFWRKLILQDPFSDVTSTPFKRASPSKIHTYKTFIYCLKNIFIIYALWNSNRFSFFFFIHMYAQFLYSRRKYT